jgi:hypothetical protein
VLRIFHIVQMLKHKVGDGVAGGFNGPGESMRALLCLKLKPNGIKNPLKPSQRFWAVRACMTLNQRLQWREGSPFYHCRLENVAYNQLLTDDQVPAKMVEKANRLMPKTVSEGGSGLALRLFSTGTSAMASASVTASAMVR